jgi:cytochrome c biogenesis protein CcmG/thiol:disulfide interchange protein DsbE
MKLIEACFGVAVFLATFAVNAEEKLPILKSGDNVYSNVTVTSFTATDVYFTHSGGIGNAKLKNLDPEMQKHFHFDSTKAGAEEKKQVEATAQFKKNILTEKPRDRALPAATHEDGDVVVPEIFAHSFRGQHPPQVIVDQWLTPMPPKPDGKFVLLLFWVTSAEQCRSAIPHVNELAAKFGDRLITIGLSNEPLDDMRKMSGPIPTFSVGTDTQARTLQAFEVTMIPHAVVIDPKGIVRFEGPPVYLNEKDLAHLLDTYAE